MKKKTILSVVESDANSRTVRDSIQRNGSRSTTDAGEGLPAEFSEDTARVVDFPRSFLGAIDDGGGGSKVAVFLNHRACAGISGCLVCG
jgi:hypothetical protein